MKYKLIIACMFLSLVGKVEAQLQTVTDNGNATSNLMQITGYGKIPVSGSGMELYGGDRAVLQGLNRNTGMGIPLSLNPTNANIHMVENGGNVGIGTITPAQKLAINGNIVMGNLAGQNQGTLFFGNPNHGIRREVNYIDLFTSGAIDKAFSFTTRNYNSATQDYSLATEVLTIRDNGNVGIGTTTPSELLSVNGNIRSRKVIVTQTGWPDYVFDSSYQLPSLDSVSSFIQVNKHLPDIPSAATVEKDGHDLGEVQRLLLKKMEEMTLYLIELKKENKILANKVDSQQAEIELLKENKK